MTDQPRLELLPAVDIAGGRAVQLVQGVAGSGGEFGDPWEAALRWQEQGAEWIHLVDLDAAFGRGSNRELIASIVGRLDLQVELSGGIRDTESLDAALATGCRRVNIGTAALEDPEWTASIIADARRPRRRSASTCAARRSRRAAGPARAATCGRRSRASTPRAAPATSSPTSTRTACSRAPTSTCSATSAPAPTARSSRAAASRRSRTSRRSASSSATGVEGAIVGSALYRGAFTLPEALDVAGRPAHDRSDPAPGHHDEQGRPPTPPVRRGQGKSIPSHGFSGDTGAADADLVAALAAAHDDAR